MRYKRVGVLLGGMSAEREVSLESGHAVAAGLRRSNFDVVEIDAQRDVAARLREANVDAVFIALHGRWGEDGTVQGMLEVMGIPYTGSSVLASSLAMDKVAARALFDASGLPLPEGFSLNKEDPIALPDHWSPPLVVKPANEGSSVGVAIVRDASKYSAAVEQAREHSGKLLVERYIAGAEVQVAILDDDVIGSIEIEPHAEFYDYSAKYEEGGSTHHLPPRISTPRIEEAQDLAKRAHSALGCSGATRVDLIVPEQSNTVILEVNTIPGMTELSLLPEIAASVGMSFDELVSRIMNGAALHTG
ncbi:MAG: D-alanine--D-alanine ligase [Deltaproteobacteria bacterium]|nr:D-alanine--D-alanine ligase [Deltaproteobacteria bacterium]